MQVDLSYALNQPPANAIEYFRGKGYAISWNWEDTLKEAHTKAFTVAKVSQLDVLQDIRSELDKALAEGIPFEQFRKNLEPMLRAKGWWGKQTVVAPDGSQQAVQLGSPYRLRTIFRTNMQGSMMVGRYKEQIENVDDRPWWEYIAVLDQRTRPTHRALDGKIFRYDDPFWRSFYPPIAWGCRCRVAAHSDRDLQRDNLTPESSAGLLSTGNQLLSQRSGIQVPVTRYRDPATGQSIAPDPAWNYNKGEAAWQPDLEKYDYRIARKYVEGSLTGPAFKQFYERVEQVVSQALPSSLSKEALRAVLQPKAVIGEKFPVAVLDDEYKQLLGTQAQGVYLSDDTLLKQIINRTGQSIALQDYWKIQATIEQAQLIIDKSGQKLVFIQDGGKFYLAVIKATQNKKELYLDSFRLSSLSDAKREAKTGLVVKNELFS